MARPIIYCLQHSERVRPLAVADWARARDVDLRVVRVDLDPLPDPELVERLVVLGGGMNTDEVDEHPWLDRERAFLAEIVELDRARVLGICLGSQLLAEVLGGSVARAQVPEIGWQQLSLTEAGRGSSVFAPLGDRFDAFEWHGDAWELPPGAVLTVTGEEGGCATQAFSWGERIHAVQFHPEFTLERTRVMATTTTDDLTRGGRVQRPEEFLADPARFDSLRAQCDGLLDRALDISADD